MRSGGLLVVCGERNSRTTDIDDLKGLRRFGSSCGSGGRGGNKRGLRIKKDTGQIASIVIAWNGSDFWPCVVGDAARATVASAAGRGRQHGTRDLEDLPNHGQVPQLPELWDRPALACPPPALLCVQKRSLPLSFKPRSSAPSLHFPATYRDQVPKLSRKVNVQTLEVDLRSPM